MDLYIEYGYYLRSNVLGYGSKDVRGDGADDLPGKKWVYGDDPIFRNVLLHYGALLRDLKLEHSG